MAGYSGTPLPQKLGINEGHKVVLVGAPAGFDLGTLPTGATVGKRLSGNEYDVLVVFVKKREDLIEQIASCRPKMTQAGGLWIAWPKKASGVPTDIVEDTIRAVALPIRGSSTTKSARSTRLGRVCPRDPVRRS